MKFSHQFSRMSSIILILSFNFSQGCDQQTSAQDSSFKQNLIYLPLDGEVANRYSEISGLTWYKDQLILLPQYPGRFAMDNVSSLFKISKQEIINYLENPNEDIRLIPGRIEFDEQGIPEELTGFQGYESVVIIENKMYLTIECKQDGVMKAYLVEGIITGNAENIALNKESLKVLPMPIEIKNYSYESMIFVGRRLDICYEANGLNIFKNPMMIEVNLMNSEINLKPFLNLEYRITDATDIDTNGCFWVINYYWPGDYDLLEPAPDPLEAQSRIAGTFSQDDAIERLVELKYSPNGMELSNTAPIVIGSTSSGSSRNWEGITRLDHLGFLLATDKHPRTILAFLPLD